MNTTRAHWGSRLAFILAAAGSAIGLGNLWKFPYITGINGGGAFVLLYLFCIAVVGFPILISELYIGQQSQKNAVGAFETLYKPKTYWRLPGWLGVLSAFLILSFYSVVGGWILDFEFRSIIGQIYSGEESIVQGLLGELFASPLRQSFWHFIFMSLTCAIVVSGIKDGLERWNKILMPALLVILMALLIKSFFLPGFSRAIDFLFSPNFSKLTPEAILEAVGHSFFTLSLGMGAIITYGSYLSKKVNLIKSAFALAALDTGIALVAGVVIFSIVFSYNLEPGAGPGLIFKTLPTLFAKMSGGYVISVFFFMLVAFAALTSAVSILEVIVAYWTEHHKVGRKKTAIMSSVVIFLVGLFSVFSTNILSENKIFNLTFFDLLDKLTSSYLLPLGGLFISLFFGWKLNMKAANKVCNNHKFFATALLWLTRLVAPLAIVLVIYNMAIGF